MPPAFNLSQDQTLQFNTCTRLHSLLTSTKPSAYAESFVTSPMTVTAIRPASFSMSTSRDAYRALESPATSHPPESPPASSRPPDTQGHHHPKYPHLSVVHVVKERARGRLLPDRRKEARLYNTIELGQGQRLICRINQPAGGRCSGYPNDLTQTRVTLSSSIRALSDQDGQGLGMRIAFGYEMRLAAKR